MLLRLSGSRSGADSERRRLQVSLLLVVLVHVALFFIGNENATPLKILGSFVLSSTLIVISQRVRTKLMSPPSPPPASTP